MSERRVSITLSVTDALLVQGALRGQRNAFADAGNNVMVSALDRAEQVLQKAVSEAQAVPRGTSCGKCGEKFTPEELVVHEAVCTSVAVAAADQLAYLYKEVDHYKEVMGEDPGLITGVNHFTVRLWDGMDGCWCDCSEATNVLPVKALRVWNEKTSNGTKKIRFAEIDYYRIFPADTKMEWDGSEGKEMFR